MTGFSTYVSGFFSAIRRGLEGGFDLEATTPVVEDKTNRIELGAGVTVGVGIINEDIITGDGILEAGRSERLILPHGSIYWYHALSEKFGFNVKIQAGYALFRGTYDRTSLQEPIPNVKDYSSAGFGGIGVVLLSYRPFDRLSLHLGGGAMALPKNNFDQPSSVIEFGPVAQYGAGLHF